MLGSAITASIGLAEMRIGLRNDRRRVLSMLLQQIEVLPVVTDAAGRRARLPSKRRGYDRLIAAHSLVFDAVVVTADVADDADIPDVRIEDWSVA